MIQKDFYLVNKSDKIENIHKFAHPMIAVINFQAGNLASVANALETLGAEFFITQNLKDLTRADKIIFPGVGHAKEAMRNLERLNLVEALRNWKKPFLGICLGMQLMCQRSEEGNTKTLGIINQKVIKFAKNKKLKIPHMGWNSVKINKVSSLFSGISDNEYFYFVHSYFAPIGSDTIAITNYGIDFSAAINYKNFYGVQFHPEKSGEAGLKLLGNFINSSYAPCHSHESENPGVI